MLLNVIGAIPLVQDKSVYGTNDMKKYLEKLYSETRKRLHEQNNRYKKDDKNFAGNHWKRRRSYFFKIICC